MRMTSETAQLTRCLSSPRTQHSNPNLKFAQSTRHPWSLIVLSSLRRDTSIPSCPSSLFATHAHATVLPLYQIASTTPRPIHPRSPANSADADECILQGGDILDLKLFSRRRTPLYTNTLEKAFFSSPSGPSTRGFGVRLPGTSTRSSVTHSPLIICTPPSGFRLPRTKTRLCVPLSFF